ncbi:MAG: hypothetical protein F4Z00_16010 [Acidimicrobiaceae bacterium]|nr:hypothetical protein [Acidimicrobiaceae bacterium]MCY3645233.1 hypothetical protein [Acidimicrobiaceae bacterium]MDE0495368.1 hypothetical protein [Acidimicrobiaceae bacterium]MXY10674.1 hypothetical protein [Acidimicrobiaceae bacterium]MXZ67031.1 hypothetical protein [Acidimicrobiaceae bacterium]
MAGPEALSVQGENTATAADPEAVPRTAVAPGPSVAFQRWPQLIPLAQLVAVVLGVFAIIWNQQQTTDGLRTELRSEIGGLRAEFSDEIGGLRAEFSDEIDGLRVQVAENGERLARIEGFLGIGTPDSATDQARPAAGDDLGPAK